MANETFQEELKLIIKDCSKWARRNYLCAHIVFILSVLGSFAASVLAATDYKNGAVTAAFAALPGLMLLINNTLRFEERTKWFWRKLRLTENYYRRTRDADDPKTETLSSKYSDESEKLEMDWPAFGSSPGQPKKSGN
ncbi:hypothetical protein [Aeromonas veronii]|uniref:hypothetical protein n=1 Tax=Aeromonas veronii TaxID=654 RepID=UPI003BA29660